MEKRNLPTLLSAILGATLLLAACEQPSPGHAHGNRSAAPAEVVSPAPNIARFSGVSQSFQAALGRVYGGYLAMQSALAEDDLPKTKEAFHSMHAILHMLPLEGLDASARDYWKEVDARIMAALHPLAASESLDSVRAYFMEFSAAMQDAVEKFGMSGAAPVFRFHCPMANGNRGADWLQADDRPRNPYFGKAMQDCGNPVGWAGNPT